MSGYVLWGLFRQEGIWSQLTDRLIEKKTTVVTEPRTEKK